MVPILSSSKKLNVDRVSNLALFGPKLVPPAGSRATDITLEQQELVLPRAANMTLIIPKGSLEETSLWGFELA